MLETAMTQNDQLEDGDAAKFKPVPVGLGEDNSL